VPKARDRDEVARIEAELEAARPFLALAKEISADVARVAADEGASAELLDEAIAAIPQRERGAVARAAFERLAPSEQWAVIERVFGDEEVRAALADERTARLDDLRRTEARRRLARVAQAERRLDVCEVPVGEVMTLGLFREGDVGAAIGRRPRSTAAARRVVLRRVEGPGTFAVVEDVFNPDGGYFVTAEYDRATWESERLPPHALVRPGSGSASGFEPVLYAGGRIDVARDSEVGEGHLHLGYAMVASEDLFAGGGTK
jgi:hypothetical protein